MKRYPTGAVLHAAQEQFAFLARTALKPCERWICRDRDFEDRRQEGLGRCWEWFSQQVAGGHQPDTALTVHACSLAMRSRGRTLVGHEHRPHHDVYDRQGRDLELRRLEPAYDHDDRDDGTAEDPTVGLARLGVRDPTDNVNSALDLESWLDALPTVDRKMVELRGEGYGLAEIAEATGRSVPAVFRRTRHLGHDLALRAGMDPGGSP
ncbi:MAG: hypothetical protein HY825_16110 [Acidobacteria bacterium]|nr:hypothetical protein [Acidobacteriota bacterium]